MIKTQHAAQSLAALNRSVAVDARTPRKQQHVTLTLMIALSMVMLGIFAQARRRERSPKKITLDRHSSFTDLTQRSA